MVCDRRFAGISFLYNPESVVKVAPISVLDQIEIYFQNKQFPEAIDLINKVPKVVGGDLKLKV